MNKLLSILLCCCMSCSSVLTVNEAFISPGTYSAKLTTTQTELITKTLSEFPNHSEMAIGFVQSDEVYFFGLQRLNDTLSMIDNSNSVFEIGSITKVFTAQLLAQLFNAHTISSLDESITPYLKCAIKGNPNITFRQLANHTSGLPGNLSASIFNTDASNPYKKWDEEKFVTYFEKEVKLDAVPGEQYQYSNVGMALLAYIICGIEGKEYEELLQKDILQLLHMDRTTTQREKVQDYLVPGYNWKGQATPNWDMAEMKGAGAMLSSVNDLSRYLMWNFTALNNQLLVMQQATKSINEQMDIALGWHIMKNKTSEPFLWHNGGTGGYKSSMAINLSNETGIIILTNIGATDNPKKGLIDNLCFDLMTSLEVQ